MTGMHRVAIANCGATIAVAADATILQAALAEGIAYPHGCQMGRCGTCKSRLIEGVVDLLPHTPFSLTAADKARGLVLACRAQPRSDCRVAWLGSDSADHAGDFYLRAWATAYVAGTPALVQEAVRALVARGLDPSHAYAFHAAP